MKKTIKELINKLHEQGKESVSKGFQSVKGGIGLELYSTNQCDNLTQCGCPPDNKLCPNTFTCASF